MKYKFITLGCKVNSYESAAMSQNLDSYGFQHVLEKENADIIVINTCTVTAVADSKSRQMIRREQKNNPNAIVCVVGCYAQMEADITQILPDIAIVIGTKNRNKIGEYVQQYLQNKIPIYDVEVSSKDFIEFENLSVTSYYEATRAYLKIQDGCDNWCSYCIIPFARGPMRSRNREEILQEAKILVNNGYQEIVLTGIHTGGYGKDLENYSLAHLLQELCKIQGLNRLRISSIEASEIDDNFLQVLSTSNKVVNHLHIPLQSGCDTTLQRMNRKYSTLYYYKKIQEIRHLIPNIAITTDIIVGFPGETEEEFAQTYAFVEKLKFAGIHVFPFSPRAGTPAATMEGSIRSDIKKERVNALLQLATTSANEYAKLFVNHSVPVLFETYDSALQQAKGHAPNYLKVVVNNLNFNPVNQIHDVIIQTAGYPINYGIIQTKEGPK